MFSDWVGSGVISAEQQIAVNEINDILSKKDLYQENIVSMTMLSVIKYYYKTHDDQN